MADTRVTIATPGLASLATAAREARADPGPRAIVATAPLATPARRVCANHRDRPAHAVCMTCHRDVCGECATEWDGINYCVACLAGRRQALRRRSPLLGTLTVAAAAALLAALSAELMVWLGALVGGFL